MLLIMNQPENQAKEILEEWKKMMQSWLSQEEIDQIEENLQKKSTQAFRLNSAKIEANFNLDFELNSELNSEISLKLDSEIEPEFSKKLKPVAWCKNGFYLPQNATEQNINHENYYDLNQKINWSKKAIFKAGAIYPQEPSSMILYNLLEKLNISWDHKKTVLDLCAAPGGKTTLLLDFLKNKSLVVANDIDPVRAKILQENVSKWGYDNCVVTNNHPQDFQVLPNYFDLIFVDAPCSGEGLWRKTPEAINEWSVANVQYCALRQKDILRDILPSLNENGYLIYSTCTYNQFENEEVLEKILQDFDLKIVDVDFPENWQVSSHKKGMYHFYPGKTEGEGLFVCVLQKISANNAANNDLAEQNRTSAELENTELEQKIIPHYKSKHKNHKKTRFQNLRNKEFKPQFSLQKLKQEPTFLRNWFKNRDYELREFRDEVVAIQSIFLPKVEYLSNIIKVLKPGIFVGSLSRKKDEWILQPNEDLAFCLAKNDAEILVKKLTDQEFESWLEKGKLQSESEGKTQWKMLTKNGFKLGWAKV